MKLEEIRTIARTRGVHPGRLAKADLILSIQRMEGNAVCFAAVEGGCDQVGCCWRDDCMAAVRKGVAVMKKVF
ncbi:MAG: SAP domain-containing protein [Nitrosomonadales bacterium]|nr:SAP domain-containing protein [Nitrosomonadales bacterium]